MIEVKEAAEVIKWVGYYMYNVAPAEVIKNVFGDGHASYYLEDQAESMMKNHFKWYFDKLDLAHREKLISLAIEKYSK